MEGETLPKSPIHRLTKEFSTKQNLEWNIGVNGERAGRKKSETRPKGPKPFCVCVSAQVYVPFIQVLFSETVFTEAAVQFCKYGTWQFAGKGGTFPDLIQLWPLSNAPSCPNASTHSLTGALTGVKGTGRPYKGWWGGEEDEVLILPQVKSSQEGMGL